MKIVKRIVIVVVLLVIVAIVGVYIALDSIVRGEVQTQSANSLKLPTSLGGASVSLFNGSLTLSDFKVGSPDGFSEPHMLTLGSLGVGTTWSNIRSQPIRITHIDITQPALTIEQKGTELNIKKYLDSLPNGNKGEDPRPDNGKQPMKLIIDDLKLTGAQVLIKPDTAAFASLPGGVGKALGVQNSYTLTLPDIDLKNIGNADGNQNGAAIKQVVTQVVAAMEAAAANSPQVPAPLKAILTGSLGDIQGQLTDQAKQQLGNLINSNLGGNAGSAVNNILSNPQSAATNPAEAAKNVLGGLLGGTKKKNK